MILPEGYLVLSSGTTPRSAPSTAAGKFVAGEYPASLRRRWATSLVLRNQHGAVVDRVDYTRQRAVARRRPTVAAPRWS